MRAPSWPLEKKMCDRTDLLVAGLGAHVTARWRTLYITPRVACCTVDVRRSPRLCSCRLSLFHPHVPRNPGEHGPAARLPSGTRVISIVSYHLLLFGIPALCSFPPLCSESQCGRHAASEPTDQAILPPGQSSVGAVVVAGTRVKRLACRWQKRTSSPWKNCSFDNPDWAPATSGCFQQGL